MTPFLNQRQPVRVTLTTLWLMLYLWNTLIYLFPRLLDRVDSIETWFLAGFLTLFFFVSEFSRGRLVPLRFFLLIVAVAAVIVFFALRQYGAGLYMLPIFSLLFIYEARGLTWDRRAEKTMCLFCAAIYISMLYQTWRYVTGSWTRETSFATNVIAEMLFIPTIVFFLALYKKRDVRVRVFLAALLVLTGVCIVKLHCRAALICLVLFLLFMLFRTGRKHPGLLFGLAVFFCILGTLFPVLYINLFDKIGSGWFSLLGKDLFTGREFIWRINLQHLTETPFTFLFGTPRQFSSYVINNNLHNLYFIILMRGGLVGILTYWGLFLAMLRRHLRSLDHTRTDNTYGYAYFALCILFYGLFETNYLWNLFMPFGLLPFFVLAARSDSSSDKEI